MGYMKRHLHVEQLESRQLMAAVPALSSNPGAVAKLYLDFDGDFQAQWGSYSNITTPAYDTDGIAGFSDSEAANMRAIWKRVSEDYAPWNLDVTTIDPGNLTNKVTAKVVIGGSGGWYGARVGGLAYSTGFYSGSPNVAFVFENNLGNGNVKYTADASSHESGHLFGLRHQSKYDANGVRIQTYNKGTSAVAPIMGNSYYATRSTWWYGTSISSTIIQDEILMLSGSNNGFGRRPDDYASTPATAATLPTGTVKGQINLHTDQDVWKFTTGGGTATFTLNGIGAGTNLDAVLELRGSTGAIIATAAPTTSLNASLSLVLPAGTYTVIARSDGTYGNMGQYTLTTSIPPPVVGAAEPVIASAQVKQHYQHVETTPPRVKIADEVFARQEWFE